MPGFKNRLRWEIAREAGARAARAGLPLSANPHKPSEMGCYHHWINGWWEAENQLAVEEHRAVRTMDGGICLIGDNIERQKEFEHD
jgi:hypothetical protein